MSLPDISNLAWQVRPEGLWLGTLLRISFQRCLRPADGIHRKPPTSLGALPLFACESHEFLLPLAEEEAVWLGLATFNLQASMRVRVRAKTRSQGVLNVFSGRPWQDDSTSDRTFLDISTMDGIYRDEKTVWAFQRSSPEPQPPVCEDLTFQASLSLPPEDAMGSQVATVRFVDYAVFEAAAGYAPAPLDRNAGYGGWLLP